MHPDHAAFMQLALEEARAAAARGEVPIGAVVVERATGAVISRAGNRTEAEHDPTAHAELLAIRAACRLRRSPRIPDCDLYVTLEPCTMCAGAIAGARIGHVFYGATDPKGGGVEHGARFFTQPTCHHRPQVSGGIFGEESGEMLRSFFRARRK